MRLFAADIYLFRVSIITPKTIFSDISLWWLWAGKCLVRMYASFPSHQCFAYRETSLVVSLAKRLKQILRNFFTFSKITNYLAFISRYRFPKKFMFHHYNFYWKLVWFLHDWYTLLKISLKGQSEVWWVPLKIHPLVVTLFYKNWYLLGNF